MQNIGILILSWPSNYSRESKRTFPVQSLGIYETTEHGRSVEPLYAGTDVGRSRAPRGEPRSVASPRAAPPPITTTSRALSLFPFVHKYIHRLESRHQNHHHGGREEVAAHPRIRWSRAGSGERILQLLLLRFACGIFSPRRLCDLFAVRFLVFRDCFYICGAKVPPLVANL